MQYSDTGDIAITTQFQKQHRTLIQYSDTGDIAVTAQFQKQQHMTLIQYSGTGDISITTQFQKQHMTFNTILGYWRYSNNNSIQKQ
jgi:hypothetical protein